MRGGAVYDPSGVYRYWLERWELGGQKERRVNFLMLNPSTATAETSDPTVRRCEGYAARWGFDRLIVTNLFAFRSTDPRRLRGLGRAAIGEANDAAILEAAQLAEFTVCAWGADPATKPRGLVVAGTLLAEGVDLRVLGLTQDRAPRHPLYMRGDAEPVAWGF